MDAPSLIKLFRSFKMKRLIALALDLLHICSYMFILTETCSTKWRHGRTVRPRLSYINILIKLYRLQITLPQR